MAEVIKAYRNNSGGVEQSCTEAYHGYLTKHMDLAGNCVWLTLDENEEDANATFTRYVKELNKDWTYGNVPTPRG